MNKLKTKTLTSLVLYLKPEEKELLDNCAKESGRSLSNWCRVVLINQAKKNVNLRTIKY
jgi:uncharacterized protein (DUF1778 family)